MSGEQECSSLETNMQCRKGESCVHHDVNLSRRSLRALGNFLAPCYVKGKIVLICENMKECQSPECNFVVRDMSRVTHLSYQPYIGNAGQTRSSSPALQLQLDSCLLLC